ncbi:hypothetical protein VNO77_19791 [Canavalia gladiata]|uniref:Uncharacterized protein n=1 Tax=Canavalia gladiata TaxID=3824 RepID=A0AAN9LT85_CANGL
MKEQEEEKWKGTALDDTRESLVGVGVGSQAMKLLDRSLTPSSVVVVVNWTSTENQSLKRLAIAYGSYHSPKGQWIKKHFFAGNLVSTIDSLGSNTKTRILINTELLKLLLLTCFISKKSVEPLKFSEVFSV